MVHFFLLFPFTILLWLSAVCKLEDVPAGELVESFLESGLSTGMGIWET